MVVVCVDGGFLDRRGKKKALCGRKGRGSSVTNSRPFSRDCRVIWSYYQDYWLGVKPTAQ